MKYSLSQNQKKFKKIFFLQFKEWFFKIKYIVLLMKQPYIRTIYDFFSNKIIIIFYLLNFQKQKNEIK